MSIWSRYVNKSVLIQLRSQPYIGVTGIKGPPQPIANEDGQFMNAPILICVVREAAEGYLVVEHTGPGVEKGVIVTQLNCDRDIGYISTVKEGPRILTP